MGALVTAFCLAGAAPVLLWLACTASRRRFSSLPDVFRCRTRPRRGGVCEASSRWGPRARARWIHDVLLIHRGVLWPRVEAFGVRSPEGPMVSAPAVRRRGIGAAPVSLVLRSDAGELVEVATAWRSRELLVGPFLVAMVQHTVDGPAEKFRRR